MLSEELILHFISKLYPKYAIREKSIMRVTRNADIDAHDLYDEDMDYRDMMEQLIKKRVRLTPVRVELSRKINDEAKRELSNFLEIGTSHIINVKTPLDLSFVLRCRIICAIRKNCSMKREVRGRLRHYPCMKASCHRWKKKGCSAFLSV